MNKVEQFAGQVVGDIAATFSGVMTNIGHKLGLYKAMAGAGAMTPAMLAEKTNTHESYVREWLNNQTAGGYVIHDPETVTYTLPDEHVPILADDDSKLQTFSATAKGSPGPITIITFSVAAKPCFGRDTRHT